MTPEQLQQFKELQQTVQRLDAGFMNLSQIDPQFVRSVKSIITDISEEVVTDYDQTVSESGSSSYNVPKQFDGLLEHNGKLIGYYNKT